jgi:hypothetical protein
VTSSNNKLFGLTGSDKQKLIDRIRNRNRKGDGTETPSKHKFSSKMEEIPEEYYKFEFLPGVK